MSGLGPVSPEESENTYYVVNEGEEDPEPEDGSVYGYKWNDSDEDGVWDE